MKTPAFWFKPVGWQARALMPFGAVFQAASWVQRLLSRPYQASIPVICVGNIIAGGAGKTPACIAIATLLKDQNAKPVFVTRGYGGSERGPLRVDPAKHTAAQVGDEALLLARHAPVWIGCNRARTIQAAEGEATHIIMDDGLQNPTVRARHNFLVIDGATGIGNGMIIPSGPLREKLDRALRRIDAVILIGGDTRHISNAIHKPIMHAQIKPHAEDLPTDAKYFAFAGIGRPEKFYQSCRDAGLNVIGTQDFADHHPFIERELLQVEKQALSQEAQLLTTEKDWARLPPQWQTKILTLPITLAFDIPELPRSFVK